MADFCGFFGIVFAVYPRNRGYSAHIVRMQIGVFAVYPGAWTDRLRRDQVQGTWGATRQAKRLRDRLA